MNWGDVIEAIATIAATLIVVMPIVRTKYLALKNLLTEVVKAVEDDTVTEAERSVIMEAAKKVIRG